MDCFLFFFFLVWVIGWFVERSNNSKGIKRPRYNQASSQRKDQRYLERIFILDAAEQGVFVPGAENIFDDDDEPPDDYPFEQEEPDPNEENW